MKPAYDLVVVGGGPAGLAAACAAWDSGVRSILVVERDRELGGILNQCIHNGFGLHRFKEELTGPEYAGRFIALLNQTGVQVTLDTMVLDITPGRQVELVSPHHGYRTVQAGAIVLAMGCRERTRGAIAIPGTRPAGVLTAGAAQRYVNMEGYLPGRQVVILGSGDIGLIMARRMTLEGARVLACVEVMPYSGGLTRNIVQCLEDYGIPLLLSHTVTRIKGDRRVEGVTVSQVDQNRQPIPGTEQDFACDTLLLSVGLIPENELSRQAGLQMDPRTNGTVVYENMETSVPGIFACGNVVHVHDLVDYVSAESERAGRAAASFLQSPDTPGGPVREIRAGEGVAYTVPQRLRPDRTEPGAELFFRVRRPYGKCRITLTCGDAPIASFPRQRMAPGEMEHIRLPQRLPDDGSGPLTLSVEEG
jgi:NADPH-dependent 2,4-dienoyl-CoA reductase/sulfur reductase-like enzyme